MLCNIIEITFLHECSPVNLLHIFRTPFPNNTSGGLLLKFFVAIEKSLNEALMYLIYINLISSKIPSTGLISLALVFQLFLFVSHFSSLHFLTRKLALQTCQPKMFRTWILWIFCPENLEILT